MWFREPPIGLSARPGAATMGRFMHQVCKSQRADRGSRTLGKTHRLSRAARPPGPPKGIDFYFFLIFSFCSLRETSCLSYFGHLLCGVLVLLQNLLPLPQLTLLRPHSQHAILAQIHVINGVAALREVQTRLVCQATCYAKIDFVMHSTLVIASHMAPKFVG